MRIGHDRIRGFDGLRAIAFLLVFISHKIFFWHATAVGSAGVWLFFVLSGFLITRILAREREEIERGLATFRGSLGRFYLRRTARIFPAYYLVLAGVSVVSLIVPVSYFGTWEKIAYFFYGTNFLVGARAAWVGVFGHFWSLAIEEQYYILFAPLALLVPRRHLLGCCLAIIAVGLVIKILLQASGVQQISIDVSSPVNFVLLAFGGVVGLMSQRRVPEALTGGVMQAGTLGLFLMLPLALGTVWWVWPILDLLCGVTVGVLLFQIFQGQRSWVVAILESAPFRSIGRISYGAYLIHPLIHLSAAEDLALSLGLDNKAATATRVLAEFVMTLLVAGLSWHILEKPVISWARRVTGRAPPAPTTQVQSSKLPGTAPVAE